MPVVLQPTRNPATASQYHASHFIHPDQRVLQASLKPNAYMNRIFIVLLAALTFFSCKKETSTEPSIHLTSGSTNQTVYADQTSTGAGQQVKFSTQGPWHAEVSESIASKADSTIDWVTLSQTSGDAAGEYTLDITLSINYSGEDRMAVIRIICGESVITITIVQKGTTESGETPLPDPKAGKVAKEIITYGEEVAGTIDTHVWFENDAEGRITQVTYSDEEEPEARIQQTFVYGADTLTMTSYDYETYVDSDGNSTTQTITTTASYLMSNGRLTAEVPNSEDTPLASWSYNDAGYLTRFVIPGAYTDGTLTPDGDPTSVTKYYTTNIDYTWEKGCPVSITTSSSISSMESDDWTATCEFGTQPAGVSNFDMFSALLESGDWSMAFGLAGLRPAFLPTNAELTTQEGERQTAVFRYEFDNDGSVTKVYRDLNGAGEILIMEIIY